MNKPSHNATRSPESNATVWLQVRVIPSQKAAWVAQAKAEGVSLSRWVIEHLNEALK